MARVIHSQFSQFAAVVEQEMTQRLARCGELIHTDLVHSISIQGSYAPPVHSPPGEPPYRQTGDLIASWQAEPVVPVGDLLVERVSSDSDYVLAQELGYPPRNLLPRPHGRRAFYNNLAGCTSLLCSSM